MKTYRVRSEGWVDGQYRGAGDRVTLSAEQAKYLILNRQIEPAGECVARTAAEKPAERDASQHRQALFQEEPLQRNPFDRNDDGRSGGSRPFAERGLDDLKAEARALGIKIDRRWERTRFEAEIMQAKRLQDAAERGEA
jgi:hypothetical protein